MSWLVCIGIIWLVCDVIVVLLFIAASVQERRASRGNPPASATAALSGRHERDRSGRREARLPASHDRLAVPMLPRG